MNFLLNVLPSIVTVGLILAYLPQIIQTYRTKTVEGVSLQFWVLMNVSLTGMLINSIAVFVTSGAWGYMLAESFNEGLALIMLIMVLKYRKRA